MNLSFRYPDKPIETGPSVVADMLPSKWLAQWKYDGWCVGIYIDGPGSVRCLTSSGKDMTREARAKFDPAFVTQLQGMRLPADTVLNAEFVGPRGGHDSAIYIFDALAWDGEWLGREPYEQRWNRCIQLPLTGAIHLATTLQDGFIAEFERLKAAWIAGGRGMDLTEGIVLKSRKGTMQLDRNRNHKSQFMMKYKFRDIRSAR